MATIGLCMIVKNEARVIRRCLESVLPLVDYILVVDTGSDDGTQETIRGFLAEKQIPGEVVEEPWRNFAHNRSFALEKLRGREEIDYGLMLDADSYLVYETSFSPAKFKANLKADLYHVTIRLTGSLYFLPLLASNRLPFYYRGVIHEFLESPPGIKVESARGFLNHHVQDGDRNQDPEKYRRDAEVLEKALLTETDPTLVSRYTLYLAQGYRDSGQFEKALEAYQRRIPLGGWNEELFICHYQIGEMHQKLGHPEAEIIQSYLNAWEVSPNRMESLHAAARYCRQQKKFHLAYLFSRTGLDTPLPERALFVETWVYQYSLLYEYSVAAYWVGRFKESFDASARLLKNPQVPAEEKVRIRRNAHFAIERLNKPQLANLLPAL